MRRQLFVRAAVTVTAAAAILVPATPAVAGAAYCPYRVSADYATVFQGPSTGAPIYDAMPHNARITGSSTTYAGTGGPFRKVIASYGSAYVQAGDLARVSGSCMSPSRAA